MSVQWILSLWSFWYLWSCSAIATPTGQFVRSFPFIYRLLGVRDVDPRCLVKRRISSVIFIIQLSSSHTTSILDHIQDFERHGRTSHLASPLGLSARDRAVAFNPLFCYVCADQPLLLFRTRATASERHVWFPRTATSTGSKRDTGLGALA